ncbi:hypothetical protein BDA96_08G210600 [Sorghum bicolor]|uniref:Uncharacterized protein n=2 Tax=Sorghum bicolor TaxID=4558 RepID=A0A921QHT7_SORBI|nr:hypothetical protein SORBI_3008G192500 [Sorghum bicolor]KAG0522002.1 hypothetical protein BDA96_08G210600 [Sorghum bicolor]
MTRSSPALFEKKKPAKFGIQPNLPNCLLFHISLWVLQHYVTKLWASTNLKSLPSLLFISLSGCINNTF